MILAAAAILAIALLVDGIGGGLPKPPKPTAAGPAQGDPFVYSAADAPDYVTRAAAGNAHPLFTMSPGGALATAARVAAFRPLIDRAVAGTGIDPNLLEGLVFVESAGRPDVIAGTDPVAAVGLSQILAGTGQTLLGMHIDLGASRRLTSQIDALRGSQPRRLAALEARREAADDRFNPELELAATVRYLKIAEGHFGRQDLAFESYHMGIGNLHQVLQDYDSGTPVPYEQVYFDSTPTRHARAFRLLASFGDDSELYFWRILGAVQLMHLYRTDRPALARLSAEQEADAAGATVLHPPRRTPPYADPGALAAAYQSHQLRPLPSNAAALGITVDPGMGQHASAVGAPAALYRGLRPGALRVLIELAAQVRALSGSAAPLRLASTVSDEHYQRQVLGGVNEPAATGWSFAIERSYAGQAQAEAFQEVLDRLQSLNLIAWAREPSTIQITAAAGAASWLARR